MQTPIAHLKASIHAFNFDSGSFTSLKRTHKGPTCSYILTMLQNQVHNFVNPRLRKGEVWSWIPEPRRNFEWTEFRFENETLEPCLDNFPNVHLKLVPQARLLRTTSLGFLFETLLGQNKNFDHHWLSIRYDLTANRALLFCPPPRVPQRVAQLIN